MTRLTSVVLAAMIFTLSACSDESETITKTPTQETPDDTPGEDPVPQEPEDPSKDPSEEEPEGITTTGKSYETVAGSWKSFRKYEYAANGLVTRVNWETFTPMRRAGTYEYVYQDEKIQKITRETGERLFIWENGRIVKSENYDRGVLKDYTVYGYDAAGNVGESNIYYRQPEGDYKLGFSTVYLYFTDGNLYKVMRYTPTEKGDLLLLSTDTYEGYLDAPNPFAMVEIIPSVVAQKNLPSSFRTEQNGVDLTYNLSYEFREDGYPLKRHVSGSGTESTVYRYY